MNLLLESQIQELLAIEKLLDDQLPLSKAAPTKELRSCLRSWSHIACKISLDSAPYKLNEQQISEGLELIQHPVFICGVHRSGTTLMRDLLDNHPQLSVLPSEGSFFTNLNFHIQGLSKQDRGNYMVEEWLCRLVNPINQPPYWLLGRSSLKFSPYVEFARIVHAWINKLEEFKSNSLINFHLSVVLAYSTLINNTKGQNRIKYWIDKTPVVERYFREIINNLPKAKFIHVVRDPVDIYLSRKTMEPKINSYQFINDLKLSFETAMKYSHSSPDHYLVIKYEDLLDNLNHSINRIVTFLGIEESPSLYQPTVSGILSHTNSSFAVSTTPGTIVKNNNKSGKSLSKEENDLLSAYVFRYASFFGYELNFLHPIKKLSIRAGNYFHRLS